MSQPDAPSLPAETIAEVPIWFVRMTNGQPWFGDGSSAYVWSNEDAGRRALLVFGNYYPVLKGASVEKADLASLLRAASERDAAVREVERLREALKFYSEGFIPRPAKRNKYGLNPGLEWKPSEALLDDCGNVAMEALASAAQESSKSVDATEGRLGGANG